VFGHPLKRNQNRIHLTTCRGGSLLLNEDKNEIEKTDELIKIIGYPDIPPVRPPYGKKLIGFPLYLSKTNHDTITWNLEPDSFYSTPDEKINYVKEHIQSGSIILMHPM